MHRTDASSATPAPTPLPAKTPRDGHLPLVSVIMPARNRGDLISESINSVLAQDYGNFELLVIDDGSTDNTCAVVEAFGPPVRCLRQEWLGVSSARNHGIREARGEFITFLDSDDLYVPTKIRLQAELLVAEPAVALVLSHYYVQNEYTGETTENRAGPVLRGRAYRKLLMNVMSTPLTTPSVMVRAQAVREVGGFDEEMRLAEDIDLWCRMAARHHFGMIEEPLCIIRYHPGNSTRGTTVADCLHVWRRILDRHLESGHAELDWAFRRQVRAKMYAAIAHLADCQQHHVFSRYYFISLLYWPRIETGIKWLGNRPVLRWGVRCCRVALHLAQKLVPRWLRQLIGSAWRSRRPNTRRVPSGDNRNLDYDAWRLGLSLSVPAAKLACRTAAICLPTKRATSAAPVLWIAARSHTSLAWSAPLPATAGTSGRTPAGSAGGLGPYAKVVLRGLWRAWRYARWARLQGAAVILVPVLDPSDVVGGLVASRLVGLPLAVWVDHDVTALPLERFGLSLVANVTNRVFLLASATQSAVNRDAPYVTVVADAAQVCPRLQPV